MALSQNLNVVCGAIGLVVVVYVWRFFCWIWLNPKKNENSLREQGLNGNSYKFMFGDSKEMADHAILKPINLADDIIPRIMPFIYNSAKTHGKNFFTWMGPTPIVHVTEPIFIRDILAKNYQFQKPKGNPFINMLITGLINTDGDRWSKHRRIINPAFHAEKLKHMLPAFYVSCCEMISKWEDKTNGRSCEVDVFPHLQTFTRDVISRTAFGSSFDEGRNIFELQQEQSELVIKARQSMYIPGSRFLPTKSNRRMKEIDRKVNYSIRKIIHKRVTAMKAGESNNDDLLSILLDSNDKEIMQRGNKIFGLSIDEVIEECKIFYFAGQDTTASLLIWTMILLGRHTSWQDRARDEVLKVFDKRKPDIDGLSRLKIINMILQEVLRLYPPVITLRRMIHEETKLGSITLPNAVQLQLHLAFLHRDSDIWGNDVNEFKPERFSEGVLKATKGEASYLPFGGGSRICIAQNFAMLEAKLALVMILQRFNFKLSPSYSHAPHSILTLQPQFGAPLIMWEL